MAASVLVLAVVFVLDLIAFALAVAAEQRRSKARLVSGPENGYTYCLYDSDIATGYGIGALVLLLASQAVVMAATRCLCCGRGLRPGGARSRAVVLYVATWLAFIIAAACLLAGSVRNAYHTRYRTLIKENTPSCQTLRKGVFGAGAAFIFFTTLLSELYYVYFSKAQANVIPPPAPGSKDSSIGMTSFR